MFILLKFNRQQWESISEAAKDLICKMLCLDPKKRLTIQEVLNHRWLRVYKLRYILFIYVFNVTMHILIRKEIRMHQKFI